MKALDRFLEQHPDCTDEDMVTRYRHAIAVTEKELWSGVFDPHRLEQYQMLFRELEQLLIQQRDDRHHFTIVIPVADRPIHLSQCLQSLLTMCEVYQYGNFRNGRYQKITVMIADDSRDQVNIEQHQKLAQEYTKQGINTYYFGQQEQLALIDQMSSDERQQLSRVIGDIDRAAFYHKGASITRNLALLELNRRQSDYIPGLIYFIDSDQTFELNVKTAQGEKTVCGINVLYELDRIFSGIDTAVLTGKVVGDPPVSSAVMAGNFLDDVIAFMAELAALESTSACNFHDDSPQKAGDAAYHDMAELFGFESDEKCYRYQCDLNDGHDHMACFNAFSDKLNNFFDGEHPTRQTAYEYAGGHINIAPARTVYTGNTVFRSGDSQFFIPFAALKLRMAGPVLGRLIKSEIGDRFVTANLPMMHRRTVDETGESECRPGIDRQAEQVDLSGEFERQFYGDVMLFAAEALIEQGFPEKLLPVEQVTGIVEQVYGDMLAKYQQKQKQIMDRLEQLKSLYNDENQWWHLMSDARKGGQNFSRFILNMEHNFSSNAEAYKMMTDKAHKSARLKELCDALMNYPEDQAAWKTIWSRQDLNYM